MRCQVAKIWMDVPYVIYRERYTKVLRLNNADGYVARLPNIDG